MPAHSGRISHLCIWFYFIFQMPGQPFTLKTPRLNRFLVEMASLTRIWFHIQTQPCQSRLKARRGDSKVNKICDFFWGNISLLILLVSGMATVFVPKKAGFGGPPKWGIRPLWASFIFGVSSSYSRSALRGAVLPLCVFWVFPFGPLSPLPLFAAFTPLLFYWWFCPKS